MKSYYSSWLRNEPVFYGSVPEARRTSTSTAEPTCAVLDVYTSILTDLTFTSTMQHHSHLHLISNTEPQLIHVQYSTSTFGNIGLNHHQRHRSNNSVLPTPRPMSHQIKPLPNHVRRLNGKGRKEIDLA